MCIRDRGDIDHGSALVGCDLLIHQVRCYAGRLYQDDRYAPPTGHVAAVSGGQSGPRRPTGRTPPATSTWPARTASARPATPPLRSGTPWPTVCYLTCTHPPSTQPR